MHVQHEGVLNFGDIRFGAIVSPQEGKMATVSMLSERTQLTITYLPPLGKYMVGYWKRISSTHGILRSSHVCCIRNCWLWKTTLTSHWLNNLISKNPETQVMYYPCQPWDTSQE